MERQSSKFERLDLHSVVGGDGRGGKGQEEFIPSLPSVFPTVSISPLVVCLNIYLQI